jgi:excinuclease UvrABC helicase subunit UvrB
MNNPEEFEIGYLIELAITGQADQVQFDEVMDRVENEPAIAELYLQALTQHQLMEASLPAAEQELTQEQVREAERQRQLAERQRLEQKNDLDLEM